MTLLDRTRRFAELPEAQGPRSLLQALAVQVRVTIALMLRGALSKYGHENLGFFWLMGEPLLMTSGVMIMWTVAGLDKGHGLGIIPFALASYTMLTLWRHVVGHMGHAMGANAGLMFHRNVKMIDTLVAMVILESIGGLAAFMIAYIAFYLAEAVPAIHDPLLMLTGWFFMTWLVLGFGMCLAALSEFSEAVRRFIPPMMYMTIPFTGAFFMLSWLPEKAQQVVSWSPIIHPFEMFRGGFFGPLVHPIFSIEYMIICCTVLTALGLTMVRAAEKHLEV
ncbi:ABC transporter permease [Xanthobacteraceae bacterium A53D]